MGWKSVHSPKTNKSMPNMKRCYKNNCVLAYILQIGLLYKAEAYELEVHKLIIKAMLCQCLFYKVSDLLCFM